MLANFIEASHAVHTIESIVAVHSKDIELRLLFKNKAKRVRDDFGSGLGRAVLKIFEMLFVELVSFALTDSSCDLALDHLKANRANFIVILRKGYTFEVFEHRKDRGREISVDDLLNDLSEELSEVSHIRKILSNGDIDAE